MAAYLSFVHAILAPLSQPVYIRRRRSHSVMLPQRVGIPHHAEPARLEIVEHRFIRGVWEGQTALKIELEEAYPIEERATYRRALLQRDQA